MKKLEELVPLHNENRNCFEDVCVTVCGWYQRRYEYMYKNSWAFNYDTHDLNKCIGKRLFYDDPKQFSIYTEHSGIIIAYDQFSNLEEGILKIGQALEEKKIVALTNMDMFWLPWTSSYRKNHGGHTFIVKDIDDNSKEFICMDPYYQQDHLILSQKNLKRGTNGRFLVYSVAYDMKTEFNIDHTIRNAASKLLQEREGKSAFDCMRLFADDVEHSFHIKQEMEGYEDWFSIPIYNNLQTIARKRMQFSELLFFFSGQVRVQEELEELSKELYQLGKMWNKLKIIFGKECVMGDDTLVRRKASAKIHDIAEIEEVYAKRIMNMKCIR